MEYIGFDYHKQYTFATSINKMTGEIRQAHLANTVESVRNFIKDPAHTHTVLEASRTWPVFYNLLVKSCVATIKLAHPAKVKAIASAKIKTDKIDSYILAELLAADLIPEAHIRHEVNREKQAILRQRAVLVKIRTIIKNRIHVLVAHQPYEVRKTVAELSDLFGKAGTDWLRNTEELSKNDRILLNQMLKILDSLNVEIVKSDKIIQKLFNSDADAKLLKTIPGIGPFLATLIATEIDGIDRFPSADKLASYIGLIPATYSSGGITRHGRITKQGNKWLRWAFVEATTKVKVTNAQFNGYYAPIAKRKGDKIAKVALARRMVTIAYSMLRDRRPFELYRKPNTCKKAS